MSDSWHKPSAVESRFCPSTSTPSDFSFQRFSYPDGANDNVN